VNRPARSRRPLHAVGLHGAVQHAEQGRALHRDAVAAVPQLLVAHIEHHAIGRPHPAEQAIDARTQRGHFSTEAEFLQNTQPRGLQDQARSHRARRLEALEHAHAMAGAD
jgi:hypothetical protein